MNQGDEIIFKTLHLLLMLYHSKQQFSIGLPEDQKATLEISRQIILDAGLTIPQFCNALQKLSTKSYTWHFIVYDEDKRKKLDNFLASDKRKKFIEKLREKDTKEISDKLKSAVKADINAQLRHGQKITDEEIEMDEIKLSDEYENSFKIFEKLEPHEIGIVVVMPFRSIERLLKKIEDGATFDQVQDADIWYDSKKYQLHVGKAVFITANRGAPIKAHFALETLFNQSGHSVIDYSDIDSFDSENRTKSSKSFADSLRNFIKPNGKLKDIFSVYSDRLEINTKYQNDIH